MSFLGSFSSGPKTRVHVSVTPGIGLEMIRLDLDNNTVAAYACRELAYNETARDIVDYDRFKEAMLELYSELGIDSKCEVVVNIPLVSFGTMQLGLMLPDDQITGAIQGEVEQSYTFRRLEPLVSWIGVPSVGSGTPGNEKRLVVYSAIQKVVIEKLAQALSEIGSTLVGIEDSLSSTFRALDYLGVTSTQMQPETTWNLLLINATGYSLISLSGKNIIDYYEEPLPIKSYEGDQIYTEIANNAQIALSSYPANYLVVVSETDQVSAELLVSKLNTVSTVTFLENNSLKKQDSIMPVSLNVPPNYASLISLQVIGCAISDFSTFPLKFNYMPSGAVGSAEQSCIIAIGEHELVVTKDSALKFAGLVGLLIVGIAFLLSNIVFPNLKSKEDQKVEALQKNVEAIEAQIKEFAPASNTTTFDLNTTVENGVKSNRSKLMNYVAAGEAIPQNVWLTYFMTQGDGLVDIKGVSTDVSAVYVFFKNMRDSLIGTKLKLQQLEMDSQSVDAAVSGAGGNYIFEITNMTEEQLGAFSQGGDEQGGEAQGNNGQSQSTPPSSELLGNEPIQQ